MTRHPITLIFFVTIWLSAFTPHKSTAQGWAWGRGNNTTNCEAYAVATDPSGNIWCGGTRWSATPMSFGSFLIPSAFDINQAIWVKYSNTGTVLWADGATVGGRLGKSYLYNLTTDPMGNLILFGAFTSGTLQIGSVTITNRYSDGTAQYFIAKINPTGATMWAIADGGCINTFMTIGIQTIMTTGNVVTDAGGNIYITSCYLDPSITIGGSTFTNSGVGPLWSSDFFVAKYSPSGTLLWANSYGGGSDDLSVGITTSPTGHVYVCGTFRSPAISIGSTTITNPTASSTIPSYHLFLSKFSSLTGAPLMAESAGKYKEAIGSGLTADDRGNIYMVGSFADSSITLGDSVVSKKYPSNTQSALFLAKYSISDTLIWAKVIESPGGAASNNVQGFAVALSPCGQVWASGGHYRAIDIDSISFTPATDGKPRPDPLFIVGYDTASGRFVNCSGISSGGDDQGNIAFDQSGNLFFCGDAIDSVYIGGDTMRAVASDVGELFFVAKYNAIFGSSDTIFKRTNISFCDTSGITLAAPMGYSSYYWDDSSTLRTRTVRKAGTYHVYSVRCGDSVLSDSFAVKYIPSDSSLHHTDTTFCYIPGDTLIIKAPSGYVKYIWDNGSTDSTLKVDTSGTWHVTAYNGCNLFADTFKVRFSPKPVVSLGNDTSFCAGDTLSVTSHQPDSSRFTWSTGIADSSIKITTSGTYSLTVTYLTGCKATDAITVTVNPLPVVNIGPDTTLCNNIPPTLRSSVSYTSSAVYLWSTGETTDSIVAVDTGNYWLKVTLSGCSVSDTMRLKNIYDTLNLPMIDTAICIGKSITVRASGTPGMVYQWLPTAGIAFSDLLAPVIMPDTSAMYSIKAAISGCPDIIDSFFIDVQPYPRVYLGNDRNVCSDDTLHIAAIVQPAWYSKYIYSWAPTEWLSDTASSTSIFKPGPSAKIYLTVNTSAGCMGSDSTWVNVLPGDFIKFDTQVHLCPHDSVLLNTGLSRAAYSWHPSLYLDDSTAANPLIRPITSQNYWAVVTNNFGCRDTITAAIVVEPNGLIFLDDSVTIRPGESYHISAKTNCTSFSWFPPAGLSNPAIPDPVASPQVSTRYIVKATTENGCVTIDTFNIYVDYSTLIDIPNAFSPGGANNRFKIINKGVKTLNYFQVFNRWGNLVFETNDINEGWDGSYKGQAQPSGVYIYQYEAISSSGIIFHKKGNLTLIR